MLSEIEAAEESIGAVAAAAETLRNDVYTAAAYGDLEKLQRLVESEGCSITEPDGLGYHALQWAALNNRTVAALYIIEHGGDVNDTDHTGQTALHWSAVRGHIQVADLLLKEGVRIDAADMSGYQVTRLLPGAVGTTCGQRLEKVLGTEHTSILRVPFRSEQGIVRKWISRFEVWRYLETYAECVIREMQSTPRPQVKASSFQD